MNEDGIHQVRALRYIVLETTVNKRGIFKTTLKCRITAIAFVRKYLLHYLWPNVTPQVRGLQRHLLELVG